MDLSTLSTRQRTIVIVLAVLVIAAMMLACRPTGACYSQYTGCEATATFLATVTAP